MPAVVNYAAMLLPPSHDDEKHEALTARGEKAPGDATLPPSTWDTSALCIMRAPWMPFCQRKTFGWLLVELGGGVHWITACPVDHVDGSP